MKMWNGRFRKPLDRAALAYSSSLKVDRRLFREDIEGSLAHVAMLAKQKIIPSSEALTIQKALKDILADIESGRSALDGSLQSKGRFVGEDVHMAIESMLMDKVGSVGGKLHTARSRNDQVALDERLFLRRSTGEIQKLIRGLQRALVQKADRYRDVVMPGYTHLQRAQPVLLAHHLLAYVSMLDRDRERFADCLKRANRSPLGAAALAGTSFPVDRQRVSKTLGFDGIVANSIDAVSDRDVQIEFLSACAVTMMHLSRFAEELVLWSSQEWRFAELGDEYTTGSSIMPQKKNPDIAELVRGRTGRVYGDLMALLTVMKGLPLAYNRDLQEDKQPLFDGKDTVAYSLAVCARMVGSLQFNRNRFEQELKSDFLLATELADYLVRKGMPFRKAHGVVGAVVQYCIGKKKSLHDVSLKEYRKFSTLFADDAYKVLDVRTSLAMKKSEGSTAPWEVQKAIRFWKKELR